MTYRCAECQKPCDPRLHEVGIVSGCCPEAQVLVAFCPSRPDKCQGCETRPLTADEERDLAEELHAENDADMSGHDRARANWLRGS